MNRDEALDILGWVARHGKDWRMSPSEIDAVKFAIRTLEVDCEGCKWIGYIKICERCSRMYKDMYKEES